MLENSRCNLWKKFDTVDWFRNIREKKSITFAQFDIIDFYPSISKKLLLNSLSQTRNHKDITDKEIDIILVCRKSILTDNNSQVKSYIDNFDVTMGSFDTKQFNRNILDTLGRIINLSQIGLYRDDGLIFIPDSNGPKTSKLSKKFIREFKITK